MSDVADHGLTDASSSIKLTASPFSNIGKPDAVDVPATAYRICNPSTQFSSIGNSIMKPGIPKLSAHEVGDNLSICPVILHPTKQLSSQVMKSDLVKTIGFSSSGRPQMMAQHHQSRMIAASTFQHSIMESQNVSPLIITPKPHVIHTHNDVVSSKAKIVPIPSSPLSSHFSVINKSLVPEYTGTRHSLVSSPVSTYYPHSDFARFPHKSNHKSGFLLNPAVIHGPLSSGYMEDTGLTIPNSQHVFKPILSPRPSILRKRDADGVLRAQKNLLPILTKMEPDESRNVDEISLNRNGYNEPGLQIDSIMVPQIPEAVLPQISALSRESQIMVEISPRKKPRKQLLPVNQDSSYNIVGDEMMYIEEKFNKNDKNSEEFPDEDIVDCNDGDLDDDDDDFDDDLDDNCPIDDGYDEENENEDEDDDVFGDAVGHVLRREETEAVSVSKNMNVDGKRGRGRPKKRWFEVIESDARTTGVCAEDQRFDYKSDKPFYEEAKVPTDLSNDSSLIKIKNKRPSLLNGLKTTWRGRHHHFLKYSDFKIKETKKQLAEIQQNKKWMSDSRSGWRIRFLLKQFTDMINNEVEIIEQMTELIGTLENTIQDAKKLHILIELIKDNIQRSKVTKLQLEEVADQLNRIFENRPYIEDVVEKYCPKDLKKKQMKLFNKMFN